MKVLIIEDEFHAQKRIANLIKELRPNTNILSIIDSVEDAVEWLKNNPTPDLLFMDIQLSDGLSFEIFSKVKVLTPVIFTTAFDEYAIKAFKINSVDYLLKPVEEEELEKAIQKFETYFQKKTNYDLEAIQSLVKTLTKPVYKSRFLIRPGQNLSYIAIEEIAYFFSENSFSFLKTKTGKKHILDSTMDQISIMVNPEDFFKINRKTIVRIQAIEKVFPYLNSRLRLNLKPEADFEVIVSREKVKIFKEWLGA